MEKTDSASYLVGEFILEVSSRRLLCKNAGTVPLTPKEFQALLILVEAAGAAVPRETLVIALWPDTAVGDTSLGRVVSVLRRHLGSEAIVSVAKFGYRLTLAVRPQSFLLPTPVSPAPHHGPVSSGPLGRFRMAYVGGTLAAVLLAGAATLLTLHFRVQAAIGKSEANTAAERWDDLGLFSLREGTYFKASKAFQQALRLDPGSSLIHGHLAEAWIELEKVDEARNEVLLATEPSGAGRLSRLDRLKLEAIRASVVGDYAKASGESRKLLNALPEEFSSNGLQDLGRSYQREGKIAEALASYRSAATLQPSNAGVQLHLGILSALQRDGTAADAYLHRATELYKASTNQEGLAEVEYQRGRMAYVRADYATAERHLDTALELVRQLEDPFLTVQVLSTLSTVQRWDGKFDRCSQNAQKAIEISRTIGWGFGHAEGVRLLANLAMARHDLSAGRELLDQALQLAQRADNPRTLGNTEFSLSDLAGRMADPAAEIDHARRARAWYASYGSVDGVADAELNMIRGEEAGGLLQEALRDAQRLLASSERTHSDLFVEDTNAEIGNIYTALEDDGSALVHYGRALELSRRTGSERTLKSLQTAAALARLGRVHEAEALIRSLPASDRNDPDAKDSDRMAQIAIYLAKSEYARVIAIASAFGTQSPEPAARINFLRVLAGAALLANKPTLAEHAAASQRQVRESLNSPYWLAQTQLLQAEEGLANPAPGLSLKLAQTASAYFAEHHLWRSNAMAFTVQARAFSPEHDEASKARAERQATEALARLQ